MTIERDDESTSFEARPWGGQQRLLPLANRFARDPNAPSAGPVEVVRPVRPAARPTPRKVASGTIAPAAHRSVARHSSQAPTILRGPQPVDPPTVSFKVPHSSAAPTVALRVTSSDAAPTVVIDIPALSTAAQAALPTDVDVAAIPSVQGAATISAPVVSSAMPVMPGAVPAFSVKYGCSLGGFVMPHIPKVAQKFVEETVAVRRGSISKRSLIAAPIGAAVAGIAIAILCLSHPSVAAEPAASAALHVQMPAVVSMPAVVAAPIVAAAQPAIVQPAAEPVSVEPASAPEPRRPHASHSHHRPHKIVAVDASTPLGNLRPH